MITHTFKNKKSKTEKNKTRKIKNNVMKGGLKIKIFGINLENISLFGNNHEKNLPFMYYYNFEKINKKIGDEEENEENDAGEEEY